MKNLTASSEVVLQERHGDRYYPVDEGYDKRFYENDFSNYVRIVFTLLAFYLFNLLHWWAIFELGINYSSANTWYNVGIFLLELLILGCMLFSGSKANYKKRYHAYLIEKISEKKAAVEEANEKKKQQDDLARMQAEREAKTAQATNIQDGARN
eukprot:CAMPEP_0176366662 /NCGR_PEP_ID=MMETSP0126-20121128/21333_1 /TAXON_ID=141414 ORGANISM="Strombidinopsis acuminatum, Strain SPMC142" /NCGR_SAMPLE_ID=MMETSP0126 /ASSEMBLY_ACC=CAM_ASM_000229 /LENGTH=153 /DNA_ID=CAMNT_0017724165 /DNA_START=192 /DNA_END=653 /DNA_ORIENTATION=+